MVKITQEVRIHASRDAVWKVITDIEHCQQIISGIQKITILQRPPQGIVGLKWEETREMFGKQAMETMWITDAVEYEYYTTRAESHGSVYTSRLHLSEHENATLLTMSFSAAPQTLVARVLSFLMAPLIRSSVKKALVADLEDIRSSLEKT